MKSADVKISLYFYFYFSIQSDFVIPQSILSINSQDLARIINRRSDGEFWKRQRVVTLAIFYVYDFMARSSRERNSTRNFLTFSRETHKRKI